jgi:membrane-associated protease RseP (regulator of RpoE activity)
MVKRFTMLHILLFFLTICTTLTAGMLQKGINPIAEPWRFYQGLPFALTLMTILMAHELSHFFAALRHNTEATLPYFIPAPSIIGTFGAFIKMKSPILTRTALLDIGASGPLAGFLVSLAASAAGLTFSDVVPRPPGGAEMELGDSLLFWALTKIIFGKNIPEGFDVLLNPVAFAGWIGLFITAMNLLPIGQLDGGHVAYAVWGTATNRLSRVLVAALVALGIFFWPGWLVWALFLTVTGLGHPPVYYRETPLPTSRRRVAAVSLVIFVITFMPAPFNVNF